MQLAHQVRTLSALLLFLVLPPLTGARAQGWVDVSNPSNTPGPTTRAAMCYDETRQYCLLAKETGQTWTYDGQAWTQRFPTTPFPASSTVWLRLVHQAHVGRPLLVVQDSQTISAIALEWDGNNWSVVPSVGMNLGDDWSLTYDRGNNNTVLHTATATWTFDGLTWLQHAPLVPPNFGSPRSFYDESRQRVVTYGTSASAYWEWNGVTHNWSQCFPSYTGTAATGSRNGPMAYSNVSSVAIGIGVEFTTNYTRTMQYGGCDLALKYLTANPSNRYRYSIAFDRVRSKFVLVGGGSLTSGAGAIYADTWELDLGPSASYTLVGAGCPGTGGTPSLSTSGSLPVIGQNLVVQVSGMPWTAPAFMYLGFSDTTYAGVSLPFNLGVLGAPACSLRVSGDILSGVPNVLGVGLWQLQIPNLPGATFFNQAIIFDPAANPLGLTLSNEGRAVIGT